MKQNINLQSLLPQNINSVDGKAQEKVCIGLIVLSTDLTLERDFRNMLKSQTVDFFVNRLYFANPVTSENLGAMANQIKSATQLIVPDHHLDVIAYGCTSGSIVIGESNIFNNIRAVRPNIPCTTPITGALKGFKKIGIQKIAILTPYNSQINQLMEKYFESQGISVIRTGSFYLDSDRAVASVEPSIIYDAALALDGDDIEGIFISCTALRAVEVIDKIESKIGKTVISSNQALLWDALRLSGYNKPIQGYGGLMNSLP